MVRTCCYDCSAIINNKLSPCVQIIDIVKSTYIWKGKIESSNEYTIKIKTVVKNMPQIFSIIKQKSNYDVPEIITYDFNSKYKSVLRQDNKYSNCNSDS